MNFRFAPAALALATLVGFTASAQAGETNSVAVYYADLNLSNAVGHEELVERLNRAADMVCGPLDNINLLARSQYRACRSAALESAMPALHAAYGAAHQHNMADNKPAATSQSTGG